VCWLFLRWEGGQQERKTRRPLVKTRLAHLRIPKGVPTTGRDRNFSHGSVCAGAHTRARTLEEAEGLHFGASKTAQRRKISSEWKQNKQMVACYRKCLVVRARVIGVRCLPSHIRPSPRSLRGNQFDSKSSEGLPIAPAQASCPATNVVIFSKLDDYTVWRATTDDRQTPGAGELSRDPAPPPRTSERRPPSPTTTRGPRPRPAASPLHM
jgi:hypothetical protein